MAQETPTDSAPHSDIIEIATTVVDRLHPSLKKIIEAHAPAIHPEVIRGRESTIKNRARMIEIAANAINEGLKHNLNFPAPPPTTPTTP